MVVWYVGTHILETANSTEMLVPLYQPVCHHITEDSYLCVYIAVC
jgi:hypothetical protein